MINRCENAAPLPGSVTEMFVVPALMVKLKSVKFPGAFVPVKVCAKARGDPINVAIKTIAMRMRAVMFIDSVFARGTCIYLPGVFRSPRDT